MFLPQSLTRASTTEAPFSFFLHCFGADCRKYGDQPPPSLHSQSPGIKSSIYIFHGFFLVALGISSCCFIMFGSYDSVWRFSIFFLQSFCWKRQRGRLAKWVVFILCCLHALSDFWRIWVFLDIWDHCLWLLSFLVRMLFLILLNLWFPFVTSRSPAVVCVCILLYRLCLVAEKWELCASISVL